jgi:hypothetical protein
MGKEMMIKQIKEIWEKGDKGKQGINQWNKMGEGERNGT